jgi:hypothetical protein
MLTDPLILAGKVCPYCLQYTVHVSDSEVYSGGGFGGMIYLCRDCNAYVGCHARNGGIESKGRLANKELREAKIEAHRYFDNMWKRKTGISKGHARSRAYKWLTEQLNIAAEYCHVGMFDVAECKKVVEVCKPYFKA